MKFTIVTIIMLLSHEIYMNYNWRSGGTGSLIWTWILVGRQSEGSSCICPACVD
jgi:hypothetical protein